ncbi:T9SS type A sorting domain-containing protein [Fulvivirga lutea]|uniref:T9SS type A sorting domain-containing protein n=1 Tax=Fulvivirga lutea TaxID=2810512 RepID=A0A974WE22_9BACT|nr:T9SS type A sorting domain-containing protein [Fulvivirga lutea]QSE96286.1 T9SS type A sorting domain-containing protein [Fulvivirga lutea]
MKKFLLSTLLFLFFTSTFSQTGPAGIGTGDGSSGPRNVLWLRSDAGVTQSGTVSAWADQSGNGLNAVQATSGLRPTYTASNASLNGLPSMNFGPSGTTNFHLAIPDNDLLDGSPGMSFFIVLNPSSNGTYGILNKRTTAGSNQAYRIYRNGGNLTSDISNGGAANITLSNAPNIFSSVYDQTLAGNKYNLYVNSTNNSSANVTTTLPNEASPLYIGNFNLSDNRSFDGDIAEVIVYQDALNAPERIIVENYLSQKYAITIGANDYFSSGDAAYANDLVGIGTVDGTTKSAQSGFSDALQIEELNGSLNSANEFVFIAHDNTAHAQNNTSNLGEVEITDRWARSWYLQASSSTSLELRFDFGTAGLAPVGSATDYVLLYRPDLSSNFTRVSVNGYSIENTDQLVVDASNISLPSGYYTIGRGAQLIPVNIYSFTSGNWNNPLTWTTDPSGLLRVPVTGLVPTSSDNVTILTGDNVTMDSDDNDGLNLEVAGSLIIGTTTGHDFFNIKGSGTIRISGNGGLDNFPTGGTALFADSIVGGTVEIRGSGLSLNQNRQFNNVILNLDAASNVATLLADYTVNGDLTLTRGILQINDNSANSRTINTYGDVSVGSNAELNVGTGNARHEFNFYGDFVNQGRAEFTNRVATNYGAEATDGIVDANFLSDVKDQSIDCFGVTNFYRIEIDKGEDQTYILDINSSSAANFNLFGPADYGHGSIAQLTTNDNALGLLRGTVRLNTNVDVPVLNNTGNYNISEAARLWVNGGSAAKPSGTAIVPYGTIQLSGGTIDAPINSGITTRANGNIVVSDGVLTTRQIRTSVNGPTNIGGYTQSGGVVNVTGGSVNQDYYTFSLSYPGNTFNMSGGTLNVEGASDRGLIFINSDPGNISVTGGTVNAISTNTKISKITSKAPFWDLTISNSLNSTNSNARIAVTTGSTGTGANESTIFDPDLVVLHDLSILTGTIRNDGTSTYGGYLDLCYDYDLDGTDDCVDIFVGSDLTINDNAVIDVFSNEADNANSSTLTFDSNVYGIFYVGDITTLDYTLTGYEDPDNATSNIYDDYRLPLYNLVIDKDGATLQLAAKDPGLEDNPPTDPLTSTGGKNLDSNDARLLYIRNGLTVASSSTLNQIDPTGSGIYGYIVRVYASEINVDGNLLVYEQGVNPTNSFLEIREQNPDGNPATDVGDIITINSTDGSTIGNLVVDLGNDELHLGSDLEVTRFVYRHGGVNLGTHNLKVDILDLNTESNGDNERLRTGNSEYLFGLNTSGARQYFYTAGNASDGGLSIKVPRVTNLGGADDTQNIGFDPSYDNFNDEYQNPDLLWFPIGIADRYTPALMWVVDDAAVTYSGDEYVTVRPVDGELKTTDLSGGDLLSYYWRVGHEGFDGGIPTVSWLFQYDQDDVVGTESNYVPGKVLDGDTYQRSYDGTTQAVKEAGNSGNGSANDGTENNNLQGNAPGNVIVFNGLNTGTTLPLPGNVADDNIDTGTGDEIFQGFNVDDNWDPQFPNVGFSLENANYTAGAAARFIGAPQIFYSRNTSQANWTSTSAWSLTRDGGAAGDYPRDGDIAILTRDNGGAGDPTTYGAGVFSINNGTGPVNIAQLVFDDYDPVNNNFISGCPRVIFDTNGSYAAYNSNFGTVVVTDRHIDGGNPQTTHGSVIQYNINSSYTGIFPGGDFGDFNDDENALVIYAWDGGTGTATLSASATEYPLLWFAGGNSTNRIVQFPDVDVTVNGRANLNGDMLIRVNNDASRTLTFKNNVEIGSGCCGSGFFEFEGSSTGDQTVVIEGDLSFNSTNGGQLRLVNNSLSNDHRLIVEGNITVPSTGTMNLGNGTNSVIDLELRGEGNNTFTNSGSVTLHRMIVNKGTDKSNSFSFNDSFTINGSTNGATKAIEIQNGTLVFNDAVINVNLTTGGDDFNIPSTGGLQITQGTANVSGDDSGIYLDGCLIVDGGTLDMDDAVGNGNNYIEYSASGNAILEISSGSLNVGSQIRPITTANTGVLKYRQTGGDVRIGTQAGPTNNRGMLQIYNAGSEFTYTGGTLAIERHQDSPSIAALYLDPDESDVTGTINIFNANTPAGQTNFGINSTITLADLNINGNSGNSPTARLRVNPLTVGGSFTINSGSTFNAAGIDLNLEDNFINDGTFTASANTTSFTSTTTQSISGSSNTTFFNFTKVNAGSLDVDASIIVDGFFIHSEGTINSGTNTIDLNGNAVLEGGHTSAGGEGIKFSGSALQQLFRSTAGTSEVGIITVENSNGVEIPPGNGYNFNINGGLRLNGGVFDIGGSNILFGASADITPVQPFSVSNMIRTNSSFADKGVGKVFAASSSSDFTYPLGQTFYTPTFIDFGTSGASGGTIFVSPANEYHPTIDDGNDLTASGDINNVLQYYWTLTATGFGSGDFAADVDFTYNDALVLAADGAESDYIAARILAFNNPTNEINKFTTAEVDEALNTISFTFSGDNANGISGDYFAGIDLAIPNNVATYTVDTNGNYNADVYDVAVPGGGAPTGSVVIIPSGFTLTVNQDNTSFYRTEIQAGGVLEIADGTSNHRLGILDGTGDLRIISNGISADLPAFSGNFLSCSGGGLEYAGTGSYPILGGVTEIRNLTLSGSGDRDFPNNNMDICESLLINGPTVNLSDGRTLSVNQDIVINGGILNTGTSIINVAGDVTILGGAFDEENGGSITIEGDLTIQGGTYISGTSGNLFLEGDFIYISGIYNSGSGTNRVRMAGSTAQNISGDFTGASSIYRLQVNNSAGINIQSGSVEISNLLILSNGIIVTNGNSLLINSTGGIAPSIGRLNSYINGRLSIVVNGSEDFPIGSSTQWRPISVNSASVGGLTWEAEYFQRNPTADPLVDNLTPTNSSIQTISSGEYWKISDGNVAASGVTARVGLSWGAASDVSTVLAEREELEVMIWNDALSSWDNLDGTSFSSGHTQSEGRFVAVSNNSFSEQIFTLGSTTANNPLPVTLVSFDGMLTDESVLLKWKTSTEINNDYFELQRSANGLDYETLAVIQGNGNSTRLIEYTYSDVKPMAGNNYYRLKQVDFDGKVTIDHRVVLVEYIPQNFTLLFNVYPNPTSENNINVRVTANQDVPVRLELFDLFGKKVFSNEYSSSELYDDIKVQPTEQLNQGIYIIRLEQLDKSITKRLIITK